MIPPSVQRNLGILTVDEQARLHTSTVAIAGLGGIGGNVALILARMGIGRFRLCDFDAFEATNINRQAGARLDTLGRSKCEVMREEILKINSAAEIHVVDAPFTAELGPAFLEGAQIAVDAIDFYEIDAHVAFHRATRKHGLYTLMGSPVGFSACLQVYAPDQMSFEEYCGISEDMNPVEKQLRYATGVVPELAHIDYYDVSRADSKTDFIARTGPAVASAVLMAASLVATEVVLLLLRRRPPLAIPYTQQFDPYTYRYHKTHVAGGMRAYDPAPALARVGDKGSLLAQVLQILYAKPRAPRIEVSGAQLYAKREGSGPCLLFLNPLGVDSTFWARQTQYFSERNTVITFDYRGTGESSTHRGPLSTTDLARDALAVLDHFGVERATVVGAALGGCVAQQLAVLAPERVSSLVLASSYLKADENIESLTAEWRELATDYGMEILFERCLEYLFSSRYLKDTSSDVDKLKAFVRITHQTPDAFCRLSLAGVEHQGEELCQRIRCPVLVLQAGADRLVRPAQGRSLSARIAGARYEEVGEAAHFFTWESALACNQRIASFLESEASTSLAGGESSGRALAQVTTQEQAS
jgi:pimeloyl-ACP methyl ester carboxylesterase/molybdopterin/thiamine biosynthesis adenylyltransferase